MAPSVSGGGLTDLASEVLPRVEELQSYVWRRHLASAGARLMASDAAGSETTRRLTQLYLSYFPPAFPSKVFTDETEARSWLEGN